MPRRRVVIRYSSFLRVSSFVCVISSVSPTTVFVGFDIPHRCLAEDGYSYVFHDRFQQVLEDVTSPVRPRNCRPGHSNGRAAALAFVQQQQPELARLLDYLRKNQPRQYQRAVRELSRTAERLSQTRDRDPRRYELELQAWKARSRIDLLAAKWQVKPDDELRERCERPSWTR